LRAGGEFDDVRVLVLARVDMGRRVPPRLHWMLDDREGVIRRAEDLSAAFQGAFQPIVAASMTQTTKARKPLRSRALSNSRGGTRTRDPGIMSETATPVDHDCTSDDAA
jgi:hypothetical protein